MILCLLLRYIYIIKLNKSKKKLKISDNRICNINVTYFIKIMYYVYSRYFILILYLINKINILKIYKNVIILFYLVYYIYHSIQ